MSNAIAFVFALQHNIAQMAGVPISGGQGVCFQQVLHQGSASESELGKRKQHDDFARMELEERSVRCEQMRIENSKQNIEAVIRFVEAMTMLDAEWKNDRQLVLQTQDVLKHVFFREYPDAPLDTYCHMKT